MRGIILEDRSDEGNRLVGVLGARTVEELKSEKAFNGRLSLFFG